MSETLSKWYRDVLGISTDIPKSITSNKALKTSFALTLLLVFFVPVAFLSSDLSPLLLIGISGLMYFLYLLVTNQIITGIGSSFFVLLTFNANIPLIASPGIAQGNLYLFDLILLPVFGVLIYWHSQTADQLSDIGRVTVATLFLFAIWSMVSVVFGAGSSTVAGIIFSLEQFRFLFILITATLYVTYTNPKCAIYPLLVAVAGHSFFAFAQAYHGTIFGLSYLGETSSYHIGSITIGPFAYQAGQHTGGFAGSSRVLVGLIILCIPILLALSLDSWRRSILGLFGASIAGILVLMADTDAGLGAFFLETIFLVVLFGILYRKKTKKLFQRGVSVTTLVVVVNIVLREWVRIASKIKHMSIRGEREDPATTSSSELADSGESSNNSSEISGEEALNNSSKVPEPSNLETGGGDVVDTSTLGIRLKQYNSALNIGGDYPAFGLGGNNFNIIATRYGIPDGMAIHNTFLAYLVATGLPGLLLFLTSVSAAISHIIYTAYVASEFRCRLAIGLLAGITGFLAMSFWTTLYNNTTAMVTFWAICGIGVSMNTKSE
ncbi:O-antigen ligase domain-containing protein [Haloterrigena sp. H1]|uniref:O-antigen ligase family protein n=1 Tax=Haloterrigena sp. H1 TaxID=2552943 RepID=UPI00110ED280|nr:O-antigen ligase family protein [Haloterrigena sp. H1]TMT87053.1 O-antigen ligase domain-containing protein [Haloterrigena sp. H1]